MKFTVLINNISLSCVGLSLDGICAYVCLCFNHAGFLCVNVFLHVLLKERDGGGGLRTTGYNIKKLLFSESKLKKTHSRPFSFQTQFDVFTFLLFSLA